MATDKNKPLLKVDRRASTEFNHLSLRWVPSTTGTGNLINESVIQWDDDDDDNKLIFIFLLFGRWCVWWTPDDRGLLCINAPIRSAAEGEWSHIITLVKTGKTPPGGRRGGSTVSTPTPSLNQWIRGWCSCLTAADHRFDPQPPSPWVQKHGLLFTLQWWKMWMVWMTLLDVWTCDVLENYIFFCVLPSIPTNLVFIPKPARVDSTAPSALKNNFLSE